MKLPRARIGLIGAAVLAALLLHSRPARPAADLYLGGGVLQTDNLFLSPDAEAESALVYVAAPGALLDWSKGDDFLRLRYHGQYWDFREDFDSLMLHDLDAGLAWRRWSPFFLEADERRDVTPRSPDQLEGG